ncbi:MAG: DsbA family protein [Alphaproteobacteria bacterium]|nr:MAG: DsbA family protein [Alphaproteobacteria bacterium]
MTLAPDRRAFLLMAGAAALPLSPARAAEDPRLVDMMIGDASAPVEIIEYASFTCPHCAAFHNEKLGKLKTAYIDTGKARLILREVYFDRFGLWAAMVARCEGAKRYFAIVDELFRTQREWSRGDNDAQIAGNLRKIGLLANIPEDRLKACMSDQAFANSLVDIFRRHAEADRVESTPTFFINGEKVQGNQPYEVFVNAIEASLK